MSRPQLKIMELAKQLCPKLIEINNWSDVNKSELAYLCQFSNIGSGKVEVCWGYKLDTNRVTCSDSLIKDMKFPYNLDTLYRKNLTCYREFLDAFIVVVANHLELDKVIIYSNDDNVFDIYINNKSYVIETLKDTLKEEILIDVQNKIREELKVFKDELLSALKE